MSSAICFMHAKTFPLTVHSYLVDRNTDVASASAAKLFGRRSSLDCCSCCVCASSGMRIQCSRGCPLVLPFCFSGFWGDRALLGETFALAAECCLVDSTGTCGAGFVLGEYDSH